MMERMQHQAKMENVSWPARLTALVGLIVFVGAVGVLLHEGLTGGDRPPSIEVRLEKVVKTQGGYLALLVARNTGDRTGAEVHISGKLKQNGETVEESTTTFAYVPDHAERRGGLFFKNNPDSYVLELRATGYVEP